MFNRLARPCVLALALCVLIGAAPPPPKAKPPVAITLENLGTLEGGKLLGTVVAYLLLLATGTALSAFGEPGSGARRNGKSAEKKASEM